MSEYNPPEIKQPIICISGGFDPIHIGHTRLIMGAARYGNLIVILNSDQWLLRKKGYVFMPWQDRCEIINAMKLVKAVSPVSDIDGSVCEALARIKPDYFANGGDRTEDNTPEKRLCEKLGIKMLWNIGGGKIASSQELVNAAVR